MWTDRARETETEYNGRKKEKKRKSDICVCIARQIDERQKGEEGEMERENRSEISD